MASVLNYFHSGSHVPCISIQYLNGLKQHSKIMCNIKAGHTPGSRKGVKFVNGRFILVLEIGQRKDHEMFPHQLDLSIAFVSVCQVRIWCLHHIGTGATFHRLPGERVMVLSLWLVGAFTRKFGLWARTVRGSPLSNILSLFCFQGQKGFPNPCVSFFY